MELDNLEIKISASAEGVDGVLDEVRSAVAKVAEAYEQANSASARLIDGGKMPRVLIDAVRAAVEAGEEAARAFNEAFAGGREAEGGTAGASSLGEAAGDRRESLEGLRDVDLSPLLDDLSNLAAVEDQAYQKLVLVRAQMEAVGRTPQLDQWSRQMLDACVSLQELRKGSVALRDLEQRVNAIGAETKASRTLLELAQSAKQNRTAFDGLDGSLKTYVRDHNLVGQSMDTVITSIQREGAALGNQRSALAATLGGIRDEHIRTKGQIESGASGRFSADGSDLFAEADAAIQWLNELINLLGAAGGTEEQVQAPARRGGGGGGKKDKAEEAKREAEEARKAQEEAWQRELDEQLRVLERKKRLGEINTQEEIRQLEIILKKYAKTAEQKLQIEEKLFEARMALRDEEIAELDKLNDGIIAALRARYEEQRRIEEERLDASAEGWKAWADKNVNSIQEQIDALDELTKTEDREAQDAAKRRKIEATRQMLEYTHDEANADQLRKELEQLEAEYAKWQRGNAIADEKERLRAEQEAFRTRAEAEQAALQQQKDDTTARYDALLETASLRAEAERMLAQANQEDILALIGSYTPDYEATGKSLGERLYAGMESVLGNISSWFEAFNGRIAGIQAQIAQTALGAVDAHYAGQQAGASGASAAAPTEVHQTLNFYEPVESPADTARKLREANEALGAQLAQ